MHAMFDAVIAGDAVRVGEYLDANAELCNLGEKHGERLSALHHAARLGHFAVVELLLAAGANVNRCDHQGRTPLHMSAAGGHAEIVRVLANAGAVIDARQNGGYSPWDAARAAGHLTIAEELRQLWLARRQPTA